MTDASETVGSNPQINILFASNRVDGTKVRSRDGDALGSLHSLMINKRTGGAVFAVLSIGGFLGLGKSFYPLPFDLLHYDPTADHYVVTIDRRLLEGGPSWANNPPDFGQAYADRVAKYYGTAAIDVSLG